MKSGALAVAVLAFAIPAMGSSIAIVSEATHTAVIISDETARGVIVLSPTADPVDCLVARDVQSYLWRMTGVEVPVLETDRDVGTSVPAIVVGRHPSSVWVSDRLDKRFPASVARNRDAFAVVFDGRALRLVGATPMATFWAASSWLESLGVSWLLPHPLYGDHVPALVEVALETDERWTAPGLDLRGMLQASHDPPITDPVHQLDAQALFFARHRLNGQSLLGATDSWVRLAPGHSYHHYLPPSEYFEAHPEWYEMHDGVRVAQQLCTSSVAAANQVARRIEREIGDFSQRGYAIDRMLIPVSPEDGAVGCECDECRRLADADAGASSRVIHFANLVAEEVRLSYPTANVNVYAYANYGAAPECEEPVAGVTPQLTAWVSAGIGANHARPMFADGNESLHATFDKWAQNSEKMALYTYYGHYAWFTPWPMLTQIAADIPALFKHPQVYGVDVEGHGHWGTQAANLQLVAALMWSPERSAEDVLNHYFANAYGAAATAVQGCSDVLQRQMDELGYVNGQLLGMVELLTPAVVDLCDAYMSLAEWHLRALDEATAWRVRLVTESWRASAKVADAMRGIVLGDKDRRDEIVRWLDEVDAFSKSPLGGWGFERAVVKRQLERLRSRLVAPLNRLPPGRTSWDDVLAYGGTIALHGRVEGLQTGRWGLLVMSRETGRVVLPLRAEDGKRIAAAQIRLAFGAAEETQDVRLLVARVGSNTEEIARGHALFAETIAIPPEFCGGPALDLIIEIANRSAQTEIALVGLTLMIEVE